MRGPPPAPRRRLVSRPVAVPSRTKPSVPQGVRVGPRGAFRRPLADRDAIVCSGACLPDAAQQASRTLAGSPRSGSPASDRRHRRHSAYRPEALLNAGRGKAGSGGRGEPCETDCICTPPLVSPRRRALLSATSRAEPARALTTATKRGSRALLVAECRAGPEACRSAPMHRHASARSASRLATRTARAHAARSCFRASGGTALGHQPAPADDRIRGIAITTARRVARSLPVERDRPSAAATAAPPGRTPGPP